MNIFRFIFQDWKANSGNPKGRIFMILFRVANICSTKKLYFFLGIPYIIVYKIFVQWYFNLEVPWNTKIGQGLAVYHGQCLVINKAAVIGDHCILRHCTTIGIKKKRDGTFSGGPVLGNHVDVGSNTCIVGDVMIKDNVIIGCGSVVIKSAESDCILVGNPAVEKRR